MASATYSATFPCSPDQFYTILTDYEKYPEFLKEVKDCKVVSKGKKKVVEYKVSVIKEISYRLKMKEKKNKSIEWEFESGDVFKKLSGNWTLKKDKDGNTEATYEVDAAMKLFVPGAIARTLVKVNLPGMFKAYQARVEELYG